MAKPRIYLNNYWSLFEEFVQEFNELRYHDIPLPLLCNFYQMIPDEIKYRMTRTDFHEVLKYKVKDEEIQKTFAVHIDEVAKQRESNIAGGSTLMNHRYLGFKAEDIQQYFQPGETAVLSERVGPKSVGVIPLLALDSYKRDVTQESLVMERKANRLFRRVWKHQVFRRASFKEKFMTLIPLMVGYIEACEKFFMDNNINCIIVGTTEDLMARVLVLVGARYGVPSICMQHGLMTGEEAYLPIFTDKIAVYGHKEKEMLMDMGVEEEQVHIIGHPRFDLIDMNQHQSKESFCETYNLDPDKKTLLIATQPMNPSIWDDFIAGIADEDNVQVIIKPHPIELRRAGIEHYKELGSKHSFIRVVEDWKVNLYGIISNVDIGYIQSSTVGLEVMLFDKPLCVRQTTHFDYYEELEGMVFHDTGSLVERTKELLSDADSYEEGIKKSREFLKRAYPKKEAGKSLRSLIEEIKKK